MTTQPANPEELDALQKIEQEVNLRNRYRIISFALFESAMRYREMVFRKDVADYEELLYSEIENYKGKKDKGWDKRARKKAEQMVIDYKNSEERFNTTVYAHIKKLTDALTKKSNVGFDNYSTAAGLLLDELVKANNTTELLIVAQGYNMGLFESFLQKVKEAQIEKVDDSPKTPEPVVETEPPLNGSPYTE